MAVQNDLRTGRHCVFLLHAHLVFVTKYRHKVFSGEHLTRMEEIMKDVAADFECEIVEFNGESNHVHLLVTFPPKVALSKLVNSLKGVSSRRMRQEFPELAAHYYRANRLWSASYFAGSPRRSPTEHPPAVHRTAKPTPVDQGRNSPPGASPAHSFAILVAGVGTADVGVSQFEPVLVRTVGVNRVETGGSAQ